MGFLAGLATFGDVARTFPPVVTRHDGSADQWRLLERKGRPRRPHHVSGLRGDAL